MQRIAEGLCSWNGEEQRLKALVRSPRPSVHLSFYSEGIKSSLEGANMVRH